MFSPGFMLKLLPFMRMMMNPLAGIFIKPDDPAFNYTGFASKENVTEIALLCPKAGVSEAQFLQARQQFLTQFDAEPEVKQAYTFTVTGGFNNKDTYPHFTVYQSRTAFDSLMARANQLTYINTFFQMFEAELICFCTTIK